MSTFRMACLSALLFPAVVAADAPKPTGVKITEKTFRNISFLLLDDPLNMSAPDWSRLVLLYSMQTPDAVVALGSDELSWFGKDDKHSLVLFAGYLSGNIQSQLYSGVKRNDRYAGVLTLFRVYRVLREKDKEFKIPEVEDLLALQEEDKLIKHLQKIEERNPSKLSPDDADVIRKFLNKKR
jgi:hypothetical protein